MYFNDQNEEYINEAAIIEGRKNFCFVLSSIGLPAAISMILILIFFKSRERLEELLIDFKDQTKLLFLNWRYIKVFVAFTLTLGSFKGFSVASIYIFNPFRVNSSNAGILSLVAVLGGISGSVVFARL